ncbi:hypothetical protein QOT17_020983 [Balamuthia mandrillaris]
MEETKAKEEGRSLLQQGHRLKRLHQLIAIYPAHRKSAEDAKNATLAAIRENIHELASVSLDIMQLQKHMDNRLANNEEALIQTPLLCLHNNNNNNEQPQKLSALTKKRVSNFVSVLRQEPQMLAQALICGKERENEKRKVQASVAGNTVGLFFQELSSAIVCSLYRNLFSPYDNEAILLLLSELCLHWLKVGQQADVFFDPLLDTYLRIAGGDFYLRYLLKDYHMLLLSEKVVLEEDFLAQEEFYSVSRPVDPEKVNEDLALWTQRLFDRLQETVLSVPYGIRWLASVCNSHMVASNASSKERRQILFGLIFQKWLFTGLLRPERVGVTLQMEVAYMDKGVRKNLSKIATNLCYFLMGQVATCAQRSQTDVDMYFERLLDVCRPEQHFPELSSSISNHQVQEFQVEAFTGSHLSLLLDVMRNAFPLSEEEHQQEAAMEEAKEKDPFLASELGPYFEATTEEQRQSQVKRLLFRVANESELAKFLSSDRILRIAFSSRHLGSSLGHQNVSENVKEAKRMLRNLLPSINFLHGSSGASIPDLLAQQYHSNWQAEHSLLNLQLDHTIKALQALPTEYVTDNYELFLDLMFQDYENDMKDLSQMLEPVQLFYKLLDKQLPQLQELKDIKLQYFVYAKLKFYLNNSFDDTVLETFLACNILSLQAAAQNGDPKLSPLSTFDGDEEEEDTEQRRESSLTTKASEAERAKKAQPKKSGVFSFLFSSGSAPSSSTSGLPSTPTKPLFQQLDEKGVAQIIAEYENDKSAVVCVCRSFAFVDDIVLCRRCHRKQRVVQRFIKEQLIRLQRSAFFSQSTTLQQETNNEFVSSLKEEEEGRRGKTPTRRKAVVKKAEGAEIMDKKLATVKEERGGCCSPEEVEMAANTLTRIIFARLYPWLCPYTRDDQDLEALFEKAGQVDDSLFQIHPKFMIFAPFQLAQQAMHEFARARSPRDKYTAIVAAMKLVNSYVHLVTGEVAPEDKYPIILYVLYHWYQSFPANERPRIFGYTQYINLYAELTPLERDQIMSFFMMSRCLKDVLSQHIEETQL